MHDVYAVGRNVGKIGPVTTVARIPVGGVVIELAVGICTCVGIVGHIAIGRGRMARTVSCCLSANAVGIVALKAIGRDDGFYFSNIAWHHRRARWLH